MVIVELTREVSLKFLDMHGNFKLLSTHQLPFMDFTIKFPIGVFLSEEQVFKDSLNRLPAHLKLNGKQIKQLRTVARNYVNSDLTIEFTYGNPHTVTLIDPIGKKIFQFSYMESIPLPIISLNDFAKNGVVFSFRVLNLITNTLNYIQSPKAEVVISERKESMNTNKNKKVKTSKNRKTYIHKKIYKVLNVPEDYVKRSYIRTAESWGVRGHWRHYKNGKKVWINSYIKGRKDKQEKSKEYRITKA